MAFLKMGMKPREFIEMDRFEKAVVIAFIKKYAKDKGKAAKPKNRRRKRWNLTKDTLFDIIIKNIWNGYLLWKDYLVLF